jgi:hypothetical protein
MSDFKERLWRELVREHGEQLEKISVEATGRPRLSRPRLLAGAGLGVAGSAAVLALALGVATSTAPAFAVIPNRDGTITVRITRQVGIAGANARLAALGIPARAVTVASGCANVAMLHLPPLRIAAAPNGTPRAMRLAQAYVPQARIDPRKIPAGRTEVIPALRVRGQIVLTAPRAIRGAVPGCLPPLPPPPCEVIAPLALTRSNGGGAPRRAADAPGRAVAGGRHRAEPPSRRPGRKRCPPAA